jgi:hypothetical protein
VSPTRFDPYAILHALEEKRVAYVLVGGLARVLQGSDELTHGLDLTPSTRKENLDRLQGALEQLNARRVDGRPLELANLDPDREPVLELASDAGEIKLVPEPTGTRGYEDLRRRATREPIGEGLRPAVADPGDLVRMLESLGRDHDRIVIETMHRAIELDRGLGWER